MKSQTRIKRPVLERNEPHRTWSTLFSGNVERAATNGATNGVPGAAPATDAVQRGVEFAYRVSDEYIRQGQAFARVLSQPFSPASTSAGVGGGTNGLPQLTERMLRYSSELSSMWMDALRMMSNVTAQAGGNGFPVPVWPPSDRSPPAAPATARPAPERIAIQVESQRRTRVRLDVFGEVGRFITVGPLRLREGKARIANVKVQREADDGVQTIVVRVPPRQAAGTYVADILDSNTKIAVGTASVRVLR